MGRSVGCQKCPRACNPYRSINMPLGRLHHLWRFWLGVSSFCIDGSTAGRWTLLENSRVNGIDFSCIRANMYRKKSVYFLTLPFAVVECCFSSQSIIPSALHLGMLHFSHHFLFLLWEGKSKSFDPHKYSGISSYHLYEAREVPM